MSLSLPVVVVVAWMDVFFFLFILLAFSLYSFMFCSLPSCCMGPLGLAAVAAAAATLCVYMHVYSYHINTYLL